MLGFCMSLRAKRSNPGSERWLMDCHGFLNENLAMTKYRRLPRRPERAPRNELHASACLPSFALQNSRFIDCFVAELLVMTK